MGNIVMCWLSVQNCTKIGSLWLILTKIIYYKLLPPDVRFWDLNRHNSISCWGSLQRSPRPPSWWRGVSLPSPRTSLSAAHCDCSHAFFFPNLVMSATLQCCGVVSMLLKHSCCHCYCVYAYVLKCFNKLRCSNKQIPCLQKLRISVT